MIRKLVLKNFKGWHELDLALAPITLLTGTNSSGKTAVLEALLLLKQTANSLDPGVTLNFGGSQRDYVDLGSYRDVIFQHDTERALGIALEWNGGHHESITYQAEWGLDSVQKVILDVLSYSSYPLESKEPNLHITLKRRRNTRGRPQYEVEPPLSVDGKETVPPPQNCFILPPEISIYEPQYKQLTYEFEEAMKRLSYLGPLRDSPKRFYLRTGDVPEQVGLRGEATIPLLISREDLLTKSAEWLSRLGLAEEFSLNPVDRDKRLYIPEVKPAGQTATSSLLDVGFGVSQVLPVITLLLSAEEGATILLEQPELHLHPSAQQALADLFIEVAKERKLQIIVETHSEYLLTRLQRRIAEEAHDDFADPRNIRLYFCRPGDQSKDEVRLVAEDVSTNDYGAITNWPQGFFGTRLEDATAMAQATVRRKIQDAQQG